MSLCLQAFWRISLKSVIPKLCLSHKAQFYNLSDLLWKSYLTFRAKPYQINTKNWPSENNWCLQTQPINVAFVRFVTVAPNVQENMGIIYLVKILPSVNSSRNACQNWLVLNLDWNKNSEQSHSLCRALHIEKRIVFINCFRLRFRSNFLQF